MATTVHLNPMQLMTMDRIGLQSAQISTQGIQPAPIAAQGIQPTPLGVQGLHTSAPITTQGIQQTPIVTQQQQPQSEAKPGNYWKDSASATTARIMSASLTCGLFIIRLCFLQGLFWPMALLPAP